MTMLPAWKIRVLVNVADKSTQSTVLNSLLFPWHKTFFVLFTLPQPYTFLKFFMSLFAQVNVKSHWFNPE